MNQCKAEKMFDSDICVFECDLEEGHEGKHMAWQEGSAVIWPITEAGAKVLVPIALEII